MSTLPWRPFSPAVSADTLQETLRTHPIVAIHFWATWNRAYDEALDSILSPLRAECGDRIAFRSLDFDDRSLWTFVETAGVVNLPAIGFWKAGKKDRVVIGLRSAAAWREIIMDVLRPLGR